MTGVFPLRALHRYSSPTDFVIPVLVFLVVLTLRIAYHRYGGPTWPAMILLALAAAVCWWQVLEHRRRDRIHEASIQALSDIAAVITDSPEQSQWALERVTQLAADMLGMPQCSMNLYDAKTNLVTVLFHRGITQPVDVTVNPLDNLPMTKEVVETCKPVYVRDMLRDGKRFAHSPMQKFAIRSILAIPLLVRDEPIGLIAVFDSRPRKISAALMHMAMLWAAQAAVIVRNAELFASRAAVAAENARLLEQSRHDSEARAMLLRELNHRVKNNLAGIAGLLSTSPDDLPADARRWLDRMIERIDGMSRTHELFLDTSIAVSLPELIHKSLDSTLADRPAGVRVEMDLQGNDVKLQCDRAVTLAMALHELCFNALCHGVGEHGLITIRSRVDAQRNVTVEVIDDGGDRCEAPVENGAGVAVASIARGVRQTGVGLGLVRGLVGRELHGRFNLQSRPAGGTIASIFFHADEQDV